MAVDPDRPSTWLRYSSGMCDDCRADCCTLPVEATAGDLVRMGVADVDQVQGSLKKLARALERAGVVRHYRASSGLFTLMQKPTGECMYLGADRRCTIYERRPDVCRRFPSIGPRPGFCPKRRLADTARGAAKRNAPPAHPRGGAPRTTPPASGAAPRLDPSGKVGATAGENAVLQRKPHDSGTLIR